jgi:hypothetical protein
MLTLAIASSRLESQLTALEIEKQDTWVVT